MLKEEVQGHCERGKETGEQIQERRMRINGTVGAWKRKHREEENAAAEDRGQERADT